MTCVLHWVPNLDFRAQLRSTLGSKDPVAGLKPHGSEGRIEPAARSPDCQTLLSEPTWNYSFKLWLCLRFCTANWPCSCPPGAGFRSAQLRSKLESKDRVAGLKHHGSEGRIGPAACSPDCQTLLSEPTIETSSKPWLYLRFCTANCQLACVVWQLAFVRRGSGQGTPSQGSNTMACIVCPKFSLRPFLHLVANKASSDALPLLAAGVGG